MMVNFNSFLQQHHIGDLHSTVMSKRSRRYVVFEAQPVPYSCMTSLPGEGDAKVTKLLSPA
eukprot:scaffold297622_cov56-Attheya_sp.AAC.7